MVLYAPGDTLGGGYVAQCVRFVREMHGFVCSREHPNGGLCNPSARFVQDLHGFVCSRGHPRGGYVAQVYVLYRKCMVLYHPGTKIVDFGMENGRQRGVASQSILGSPPFLYSNLY